MLHRSSPSPAITTPKREEPARAADAAFEGVVDADALDLDADTEADSDADAEADETDAVAALDGAVRMAVVTDVVVVGATIMPPGAVEALTVELSLEGASSGSPVEKTVQACLPPPKEIDSLSTCLLHQM